MNSKYHHKLIQIIPISNIRASTTERVIAKCKPILPFRPKMPTPLEVVKCKYCKKKKIVLQCDSKRITVYLNCKTKNVILFSHLSSLLTLSLSFLCLLFSHLFLSTTALSSPQTQNSIFLKPKTPCDGGSGRGRRGSSNTTSSSLQRRSGLCGSGGGVGLGRWSVVVEWVCGVG